MDKRGPAPRSEVNCPAWIDFGDGSPLLDCKAVNLSRTGAKLAVTPKQHLPDKFTVRFTPDGAIAIMCKVIWAKEIYVGVCFVARDGAP
jgi:hypothetical protein